MNAVIGMYLQLQNPAVLLTVPWEKLGNSDKCQSNQNDIWYQKVSNLDRLLETFVLTPLLKFILNKNVGENRLKKKTEKRP